MSPRVRKPTSRPSCTTGTRSTSLFDISEANKRAELSYILNPAFQGMGYMAEAIYAVMDYCFNTAGINRLQARCTPDNAGSESIMKRMGMSYEGKLKQYWLIKGAYADAVIYAITAGEFHERGRSR